MSEIQQPLKGIVVKLTRRRLLHLTAGPIALPITSRIAMAQNNPSPPREGRFAERLAAYAHALRHDDLDAATVERIKVHVIDTIGCGIGAFEEKAVRICREIALAVPGTATVIGTSRRTTPDLASFANGAAFRYLDFNDTYVGRFAVHPSDTIGACLAVAEAERANAQDLITAIALAYEVNSRLVDSLDIAARGWYPAVIYTQTAIVAGIEVAKEVGSLDRIASIEIATTGRGFERTGSEPEKWSPQTRETADHSLPYITARAMVDGDITNESFAPQMYRDPRILAFMQKIKVSEDPILTARVGGAVPTRVTAILLDGQRISREIDYAPGFAARPMNRDEIERKFRGNVGKRWEKDRTDRILRTLWALDRTDDLPSLLGELALPT